MRKISIFLASAILAILISLIVLCSLSQPAYGYSYTSTPPSNPRLRHTADGKLPPSCSLNADGSQMNWQPTVADLGQWQFNVSATDASGHTAIKQIAITVWATTDVNGDYYVDVRDILLVGQHMNEEGSSGWIDADVNLDGVISILDLIDVSQDIIEEVY